MSYSDTAECQINWSIFNRGKIFTFNQCFIMHGFPSIHIGRGFFFSYFSVALRWVLFGSACCGYFHSIDVVISLSVIWLILGQYMTLWSFYQVPCQVQIGLYDFPGFQYGSGFSRILPFLVCLMKFRMFRKLMIRGLSDFLFLIEVQRKNQNGWWILF